MTPLIVITRDRVSYTRLCLESLTPYELDIHIVDHGSTWEPMLDWLDQCPYPVHRRGDLPPRALWEWDGLQRIVAGRPYLVTDPDIVLDADIPQDWLCHMFDQLAGGDDVVKVGLGLRLDDLPNTPLAAKVYRWESAFWCARTAGGYRAPVDTTIALYQPLPQQPEFRLGPAIRLDSPYVARHLPWYGDLDEAETDHYRRHALPGASHWINGGW